MKKKMETEKDLIKKYFWKQKKEELLDVFLVFMGIWAFVGFILIVIGTFALINPTEIEMTKNTAKVFIVVGAIPIIFWIVYGICSWIDNNLEKAKEKAKAEILGRKTKGKRKK